MSESQTHSDLPGGLLPVIDLDAFLADPESSTAQAECTKVCIFILMLFSLSTEMHSSFNCQLYNEQ
jgi:hypothetical protein